MAVGATAKNSALYVWVQSYLPNVVIPAANMAVILLLFMQVCAWVVGGGRCHSLTLWIHMLGRRYLACVMMAKRMACCSWSNEKNVLSILLCLPAIPDGLQAVKTAWRVLRS